MCFSTSEAARLDHGAKAALSLDGPSHIAVPASSDPAAPVTLGILERAGIYRVQGMPEGELVQFRIIAANLLDETESAVATNTSIRISGQVVTSASGQGGPREIWPWLILAALVLLSIEWLLNAWLMRV